MGTRVYYKKKGGKNRFHGQPQLLNKLDTPKDGINCFIKHACRRYAMSIIDMNINVKSPALSDESKNRAFAHWETRKTAEERLRHSDYLELRNVSCDFHEGVLTLRGRVPSYHLKQLAQSLLSELAGMLKLNNQLEVVPFRDARQSNCRPINHNPQPRRYI